MRKHWLGPAALLLALGGCATPAVISDISDSAVRVQGDIYTPSSAILTEAHRGCGLYGKLPTAISSRQTGPYGAYREHLLACH
jgi:hypothetical protein